MSVVTSIGTTRDQVIRVVVVLLVVVVIVVTFF